MNENFQPINNFSLYPNVEEDNKVCNISPVVGNPENENADFNKLIYDIELDKS